VNLSAPFILRPIATSLLMAGLLLCGLTTYPLLPVGALPNFNYPTIPIQISAQLPGADPQTRALALARGQQPKVKNKPGFSGPSDNGATSHLRFPGLDRFSQHPAGHRNCDATERDWGPRHGGRPRDYIYSRARKD